MCDICALTSPTTVAQGGLGLAGRNRTREFTGTLLVLELPNVYYAGVNHDTRDRTPRRMKHETWHRCLSVGIDALELT